MTHSEVYWAGWNFIWNTLYLETDSFMFTSHGRPFFLQWEVKKW